MAHFQRFGPISYRLARAMLGNDDAAAQALERAFTGFGQNGARWPEWYVALGAVHRECTALRSGVAGATPGPELPADDDHAPVPAATIGEALGSLPEEERTVLWQALMGEAGPDAKPALAAALRRLEIAVDNQDIPGEEGPEWRP